MRLQSWVDWCKLFGGVLATWREEKLLWEYARHKSPHAPSSALFPRRTGLRELQPPFLRRPWRFVLPLPPRPSGSRRIQPPPQAEPRQPPSGQGARGSSAAETWGCSGVTAALFARLRRAERRARRIPPAGAFSLPLLVCMGCSEGGRQHVWTCNALEFPNFCQLSPLTSFSVSHCSLEAVCPMLGNSGYWEHYYAKHPNPYITKCAYEQCPYPCMFYPACPGRCVRYPVMFFYYKKAFLEADQGPCRASPPFSSAPRRTAPC